MTTLLLDASVLLAAFDPEDDHYEPARALLEDDKITLATLDLAAMRSPTSRCGRGAHRRRWRRYWR